MPKPKAKKKKSDEYLTQEEIDTLSDGLTKFEDKFYISLTGTDRFEIIPTKDESGRTLTKEQLSLIKQECLRLGVKPLYRIETKNSILLVNPDNLKIGYLTDGTVH
jgi:hypothetical protein